MADVVNSAYTIIFVGILLLIGVLVFATVADPMGDQWHPKEEIIAALGCGNGTSGTTFDSANCTGTIDHPPIENATRAQPIVYNCSTVAGGTCQTMTVNSHYNFTDIGDLFHILDDIYSGSIAVSYWEDSGLGASADNAQQSITSTVYGGFDLATVMVIVMAAVGIISVVFLIGRRGA